MVEKTRTNATARQHDGNVISLSRALFLQLLQVLGVGLDALFTPSVGLFLVSVSTDRPRTDGIEAFGPYLHKPWISVCIRRRGPPMTGGTRDEIDASRGIRTEKVGDGPYEIGRVIPTIETKA